MSKIIVSCTCPTTKKALYVADVKPGLLQKGEKGDWGYSHNVEKAVNLTILQADICMKGLKVTGRFPIILSV